MWVCLRLLFAVGIGLYGIFRPKTRFDKIDISGVDRCFYAQKKIKGKVVGVQFGTPFPHRILCQFTRENWLDRFCKRVLFSREIQTGDLEFDQEIYVTGDHPALGAVLRKDAGLREAVRELFASDKTEYIQADGEHLWVSQSDRTEPSEKDVRRLLVIRTAFAGISEQPPHAAQERVLRRARLVEVIVWAVTCYGLAGWFELLRREPLYFNWPPVIVTGLIAGGGMSVFSAGLIGMLLRGSSRASRVLADNAVVFALLLPLASIFLVSDLNRMLDFSEPVLVQRPVVLKTYRYSSGRGGGDRYQFDLGRTKETKMGELTPTFLEVDVALYEAVEKGQAITFRVREGALNFPWLEEITAGAPPVLPGPQAK